MSSTSATSSPLAHSEPSPKPCPNCDGPLYMVRLGQYNGHNLTADYACRDCLACIHVEAPLP